MQILGKYLLTVFASAIIQFVSLVKQLSEQAKDLYLSVDEQICPLLTADVSAFRRGQYMERGRTFRFSNKYWCDSYGPVWDK